MCGIYVGRTGKTGCSAVSQPARLLFKRRASLQKKAIMWEGSSRAQGILCVGGSSKELPCRMGWQAALPLSSHATLSPTTSSSFSPSLPPPITFLFYTVFMVGNIPKGMCGKVVALNGREGCEKVRPPFGGG